MKFLLISLLSLTLSSHAFATNVEGKVFSCQLPKQKTPLTLKLFSKVDFGLELAPWFDYYTATLRSPVGPKIATIVSVNEYHYKMHSGKRYKTFNPDGTELSINHVEYDFGDINIDVGVYASYKGFGEVDPIAIDCTEQ